MAKRAGRPRTKRVIEAPDTGRGGTGEQKSSTSMESPSSPCDALFKKRRAHSAPVRPPAPMGLRACWGRRREVPGGSAVALAHEEEDGVLRAVLAVAVALAHGLEGALHLGLLARGQRASVLGEVLEDVLLVAPQHALALLEVVVAQVAEEIREDARVVHLRVWIVQLVRANLRDEPPAEPPRILAPRHPDGLHLRHALLVHALHGPGVPVADLLALHPVAHVVDVALHEFTVLALGHEPHALAHLLVHPVEVLGLHRAHEL